MDCINDINDHMYILIMNDKKLHDGFIRALKNMMPYGYLNNTRGNLYEDLPEYCRDDPMFPDNLVYVLAESMGKDVFDYVTPGIRAKAEEQWNRYIKEKEQTLANNGQFDDLDWQEGETKEYYGPECEIVSNDKQPEKNLMKFETKQFINDVDVNTMSKEQLIQQIAKSEAELEKLDKIKAKSKAIDAEKERITSFIAEVVKVLDSK